MASLQEHLEEEAKARERVDKHLTKRSATESSILKEVLTLVTLYGKLGESIERIESKLDRLMDSEEEQEPDLFAKTVNMPRPFASDEEKMESYTRGRERREREAKTVNLKASLPGAYVTTSQPDWPKHNFSDDDYDPESKRWIWRTKEDCGCRNCTLGRRMNSRDLESEDPAEWERQERLSSETAALNERFASYAKSVTPCYGDPKVQEENFRELRDIGLPHVHESGRAECVERPYGPPPGFPDEDQSYGEYDDAG